MGGMGMTWVGMDFGTGGNGWSGKVTVFSGSGVAKGAGVGSEAGAGDSTYSLRSSMTSWRYCRSQGSGSECAFSCCNTRVNPVGGGVGVNG